MSTSTSAETRRWYE